MDDKEPFLSRWSRRKLEANEDAPAAAPAEPRPAAVPAAPLPQAIGPPATRSAPGVSAEYREFFDPQVDETLRRTALKKLFGDPHFNAMDGLDTYVDDYSKPDPIPQAMLRQLNQAKDLFLFDDEPKANEGADAGAAAGEAASAAPDTAADAAAPPEAPPEDAPDETAGAATGSAAAPPAPTIRSG